MSALIDNDDKLLLKHTAFLLRLAKYFQFSTDALEFLDDFSKNNVEKYNEVRLKLNQCLEMVKLLETKIFKNCEENDVTECLKNIQAALRVKIQTKKTIMEIMRNCKAEGNQLFSCTNEKYLHYDPTLMTFHSDIANEIFAYEDLHKEIGEYLKMTQNMAEENKIKAQNTLNAIDETRKIETRDNVYSILLKWLGKDKLLNSGTQNPYVIAGMI